MYYSAVPTYKGILSYFIIGTIRYGGKINNTHLDPNLYLLDKNTEWKILSLNETNVNVPEMRYGQFMINFNTFVIMYGGMTLDNKILGDLWVLDLHTMEWLFVDLNSNTVNLPKPKFLASGELLENTGQIVIHGGKSTLEDKTLAFLNINILLDIIRNPEDLHNFDEKYFNYISKINKLWNIVEIEGILLPNIRFKFTIWSYYNSN